MAVLRSLYIVFLCLFSAVSSAALNDSLVKAGTLKVLVWSGSEHYLPREGSALLDELQLLERFSEQQSLTIEEVPIKEYEELIPALLSGKGDVIAANMTITRQRAKQVSFTAPVNSTYEYLVVGAKSKPLSDGKDLNGRTVYVPSGTTFLKTAQGLKKAYPGLAVKEIESATTTDDLMSRVASGQYDLTIEDGNSLAVIRGYRQDVKRSLQASAKRSLGWAVAPGNQTLLAALNAYLNGLNKKTTVKKQPANQWEKIKANKTLRVALRNNMASYFIWRGELYGFNYELARDFAKKHGVRYQIVVAPDNESMLKFIAEDKADIALGYFTPNERRRNMGLAFSRPYHYASEVVVTTSKDNSINTLNDLAGRVVHARQSSSYWDTLEGLQSDIKGLTLKPVDETIETEEIIHGVADGQFDLTIADSHLLDLELTWRDDVKGTLSIGEPKGQSWAVSDKNTVLLKEVNKYIKQSYRGLFYNVNYKKYFKNTSRINRIREDYSELRAKGTLSPYDALVKEYAKQYGFDWRLLVSQMYQESRFDPGVTSWAGAQGLFQVMPRTAKSMGFDEVVDPKSGIHAGVKYLQWVQERMSYSKPQEDELIWFTLASYNAGAGHVRDAIKLAREKGWRGDLWFDHVEKAMLLLSKKEYASRARHGYVRGHEPVNYVRNIRKRYEAYKAVTN